VRRACKRRRRSADSQVEEAHSSVACCYTVAVPERAAVRVERRADAYIVRMENDRNEFDDAFVAAFHRALDDVESELDDDDRAAARPVVTTGSGKYFSNGFDLEHLGRLGGDGSDGGAAVWAFVETSCALLSRILTFPAPTVAAVNGHAFGIGGMLALAHDQQVMRDDRGWFCLPEIDLGLAFHPFMLALITARLPPRAAQAAMLTGRRYDGAAACTAGIVDAVAPAEDLLASATALAAAWTGKQPRVVAAVKSQLHAPITTTLEH
jgi:enoyl-CoA hydratase/carnithine racemase